MSKMDNQVIRTMQSVDRSYGDVAGKRIVQTDKSKKHPQQFNRMSVKDLLNMEDGDYDENEEYETEN